jgi:hypothetical protein
VLAFHLGVDAVGHLEGRGRETGMDGWMRKEKQARRVESVRVAFSLSIFANSPPVARPPGRPGRQSPGHCHAPGIRGRPAGVRCGGEGERDKRAQRFFQWSRRGLPSFSLSPARSLTELPPNMDNGPTRGLLTLV